MGLDQYMYAASQAGAHKKYWENVVYDPEIKDFRPDNKQGQLAIEKPTDIAYFRKHPSLQGYMQKLYAKKTGDDNPDAFNGIEVELSEEDLKNLLGAVENNELPFTTGFFFGKDSSNYYKSEVINAIAESKIFLVMNRKIFYNSSW